MFRRAPPHCRRSVRSLARLTHILLSSDEPNQFSCCVIHYAPARISFAHRESRRSAPKCQETPHKRCLVDADVNWFYRLRVVRSGPRAGRYFWPDPESAIKSLKRVIARDGVLAIGFTGAEKMSRYGKVTGHGFRWYRPEEVADLVKASGFRDVRTTTLDGKVTRGDFVVLGRR